VDYRKLNEKTPTRYHISQKLHQLGQAKYFSCIDVAMGYHQMEIDPEDIDKTAFSTKQGHCHSVWKPHQQLFRGR